MSASGRLTWRRASVACLLLASTTLILGCSTTATGPVDLAAVRCPPLAPAVRAEVGKTAQPPARSVSRPAVREWIDGLTGDVARKDAALASVIRDYDACRGVAP